MQANISKVQVYDERDEARQLLSLQQASECVENVGGERYIRIVSNSTDYNAIYAYSYILYNNKVWYAKEDYVPQQMDGYYAYDVKFYHPQCLLENFVLSRPVSVTDPTTGVTSSWFEPNFAVNANKETICRIVVSAIQECINVRFPNQRYAREFDRIDLPVGNNYANTKLYPFSFTGNTIKEVLDEIADVYECDWWYDMNTLYMEKHQTSTIHQLGINYNENGGLIGNTTNGIASFKFQNSNSISRANRLFPYGSDRNITPKQARENGMDISYDGRLRLEENHTYQIPLTSGGTAQLVTDYRGGVGVIGGIEEVFIDEEIYPSITFQVGSVTQRPSQRPIFDLNAVAMGTTAALLQTQIQIAPSMTATIVFNSGNLNGMEFEVRFKTNAEKFGNFNFAIVPKEDDFSVIPSGALRPNPNDTFVLLGIVMPQAYVLDAQQRLAERAYEELEERRAFQPQLNVTLDPRFVLERGVYVNLGDVVEITDFRYGTNFYTNRIEMLKYPLSATHQVELRLSEKRIKGLIKERETELRDLRQWWEKYTAAALGGNRYIEASTDERIEALNRNLSNLQNSSSSGVTSTGRRTLLGASLQRSGNVYSLSKSQLSNADGTMVNIPSTDIDTSLLDPQQRYYVYADIVGDTANVVVVDERNNDIDVVDISERVLIATIRNDEGWVWTYSNVKALSIGDDGSVVTDILPQEMKEIQGVTLGANSIYVGKEVLLSDTAADRLRKRIGGGGEGSNGKSAYDIAVEYGFKGSEEEWLKSLQGVNGDKGDKGDKGDTYTLTSSDIEKIATMASERIQNADNIGW